MGHPKVSPAAVFDIITPDLTHGPELASAELIGMMSRCLDMFPNLAQNYDIHISHSRSMIVTAYYFCDISLKCLFSYGSGDGQALCPRPSECGGDHDTTPE